MTTSDARRTPPARVAPSDAQVKLAAEAFHSAMWPGADVRRDTSSSVERLHRAIRETFTAAHPRATDTD